MKTLTDILDDYVRFAAKYGYMECDDACDRKGLEQFLGQTKLAQLVTQAQYHIDRAKVFIRAIAEESSEKCEIPIANAEAQDGKMGDGWFDNRAMRRREYWRSGRLVSYIDDSNENPMDPPFGSLRDAPKPKATKHPGVAKNWNSSPPLKNSPHIRFVDGDYFQCVCGSTCWPCVEFKEWLILHRKKCATREV